MSKSILITGSRRGIGYGTARELAKKGYKVFATVHREESIEETKEKLKADNVDMNNVEVFKLLMPMRSAVSVAVILPSCSHLLK